MENLNTTEIDTTETNTSVESTNSNISIISLSTEPSSPITTPNSNKLDLPFYITDDTRTIKKTKF